MRFEIRLAKIDDAKIINQLAHQIWPESYSLIISKEQIDYMLDKMYNIESLKKEITSNHTYHIIYENETPIGFAGHHFKKDSDEIYRLNRLYVLPKMHGNGIGKMLLNEVELFAKNKNAHFLELNVNKQNPAIQFYLSQGFTKTKEEVLDIGNGFVMDDFIMTKSL